MKYFLLRHWFSTEDGFSAQGTFTKVEKFSVVTTEGCNSSSGWRTEMLLNI